jgi:hypothetical protein
MVACATQQLRAVVRLGRLCRGEAVIVAVLLAQVPWALSRYAEGGRPSARALPWRH